MDNGGNIITLGMLANIPPRIFVANWKFTHVIGGETGLQRFIEKWLVHRQLGQGLLTAYGWTGATLALIPDTQNNPSGATVLSLVYYQDKESFNLARSSDEWKQIVLDLANRFSGTPGSMWAGPYPEMVWLAGDNLPQAS